MSRPLIANQRTGVLLGMVLAISGAYVLYDAYDARGKSRPFLMRFVPG